MSRRAPWLIGAGVGAVALGGAIYLIWKYTEDEEEEKLGRSLTRFETIFNSLLDLVLLFRTLNKGFAESR